MPLDMLEHMTAGYCDYDRHFYSAYLVPFYFTHYIVGIVLLIVGFRYIRDVYLLVLSFGIFASILVNMVLRWTFAQTVPVPTCGSGSVYCVDPSVPWHTACGEAPFPSPPPPGATCGAPPLDPCLPCTPCGMPALEPQLTAFTIGALGMFGMQFHASRMRPDINALLVVIFALVIFAHVYIGFNTGAQVLVGVAVGLLLAALCQLFFVYVIHPRLDAILRFAPLRYLGYHDALCNE